MTDDDVERQDRDPLQKPAPIASASLSVHDVERH